MLILLIQWIIISLVGLTFGHSIFKILTNISTEAKEKSLPQIFTFLLGISAINFLGNLWSLFFAVNLAFQILLLALSLLLILKHREVLLPVKNVNYYILLPLTALTLIIVLQPTSNVDEAGYYLPQVRWLESFPVIKGTALFIARLGFNSAIHMLSAIFGGNSLVKGGVYELNGLLFIWFNYHLISAAIRLYRYKSDSQIADFLLAAALIFPFSFLIDAMDSDYLVTMGSIVLIARILSDLKSKAAPSIAVIIKYFLIIALLIQTKPFAGLLLVGPLCLLFFSNRSLVTKTGILFCMIIVMLPWIVRNVLISGYLIFPAYYLDLFSCVWKIPQEMAEASLNIIEEHAKVQSIRLDYKLTGIEKMRFGEWFPTWFSFQKEQVIGWFILIFGPLSFILSLAVAVVVYLKKLDHKVELLFLAFSFAVTLIWFFNFPAVRFGWSWLLSFIIVSFFLGIQLFAANLNRLGIIILLALVGMSWTRLSYRTLNNSENLSASLFLPPKTISDIDHNIIPIDNIARKISKDAYCHGAYPPCQPYNNTYKIVAIGSTIKDGFRVEEKEENTYLPK